MHVPAPEEWAPILCEENWLPPSGVRVYDGQLRSGPLKQGYGPPQQLLDDSGQQS